MQDTKIALFDVFIAKLNASPISYCLLGGYEEYPRALPTDIDFMVLPEHFQKLPAFFQAFAATTSAQLVQALRHETTACYYVLAKLDGINLVFLHPDACSDYRRNGRIWLRAEQVLGRRRPHPAGFYVPAPEDAFLYYLIKKIEKGLISDSQGGRLVESYSESPAACLAELGKRFPAVSRQLVQTAIEQEDWRAFRDNIPRLSADLRRSAPGEGLFSRNVQRVLEFARKIRRMIKPTGVFVVFLGPDGSGKSSVISNVVPALAPAFRRTEVVHLRPGLGRRKGGTAGAVTDPHGSPDRGGIASVIKIVYFLVDYVLGYFFVIRPRLVRSTLVVYDRYYHDMLVDPRRYRYGAPLGLARWAGKWIPKPDLFILLDAPPEVMQARKQEVPFEETVRQRAAYLDLLLHMDNGVVVDASHPLDVVVGEVEKAILKFMAERTKQREGF